VRRALCPSKTFCPSEPLLGRKVPSHITLPKEDESHETHTIIEILVQSDPSLNMTDRNTLKLDTQVTCNSKSLTDK